jgi:putative holliday junction resolvase
MAHYMAFDFGLRRIGMAVGQNVTMTASPLPIFPAQNGLPHWPTLLKDIKKWQPKGLIVGLPLNSQGQDYFLTKEVRIFAKSLEQYSQLPVHLINEQLTTKSARNIVEESQLPRSKRKYVDSISACLILEEWLKVNFSPSW